MAGLFLSHVLSDIPDANPRTMVQIIAASNHRVLLHSIWFGPQGATSASAPLLFEILRQTSAGTPGATPTPIVRDSLATEAAQTDIGEQFTAEPTAGEVLDKITLHQQSAVLWKPPTGVIIIPGGGRLGVRSVGATYVDMQMALTFEE